MSMGNTVNKILAGLERIKIADQNGDGKLTKQEDALFQLSRDAKSLWDKMLKGEWEEAMELIDTSKDGGLDEDLEAKQTLAAALSDKDTSKNKFLSLTELGSGAITSNGKTYNFGALTDIFGSGSTAEFQVEDLLLYNKLLDKNADGSISTDEVASFKAMLEQDYIGAYSNDDVVSALRKALQGESLETKEQAIVDQLKGNMADDTQWDVTKNTWQKQEKGNVADTSKIDDSELRKKLSASNSNITNIEIYNANGKQVVKYKDGDTVVECRFLLDSTNSNVAQQYTISDKEYKDGDTTKCTRTICEQAGNITTFTVYDCTEKDDSGKWITPDTFYSRRTEEDDKHEKSDNIKNSIEFTLTTVQVEEANKTEKETEVTLNIGGHEVNIPATGLGKGGSDKKITASNLKEATITYDATSGYTITMANDDVFVVTISETNALTVVDVTNKTEQAAKQALVNNLAGVFYKKEYDEGSEEEHFVEQEISDVEYKDGKVESFKVGDDTYKVGLSSETDIVDGVTKNFATTVYYLVGEEVESWTDSSHTITISDHYGKRTEVEECEGYTVTIKEQKNSDNSWTLTNRTTTTNDGKHVVSSDYDASGDETDRTVTDKYSSKESGGLDYSIVKSEDITKNTISYTLIAGTGENAVEIDFGTGKLSGSNKTLNISDLLSSGTSNATITKSGNNYVIKVGTGDTAKLYTITEGDDGWSISNYSCLGETKTANLNALKNNLNGIFAANNVSIPSDGYNTDGTIKKFQVTEGSTTSYWEVNEDGSYVEKTSAGENLTSPQSHTITFADNKRTETETDADNKETKITATKSDNNWVNSSKEVTTPSTANTTKDELSWVNDIWQQTKKTVTTPHAATTGNEVFDVVTTTQYTNGTAGTVTNELVIGTTEISLPLSGTVDSKSVSINASDFASATIKSAGTDKYTITIGDDTYTIQKLNNAWSIKNRVNANDAEQAASLKDIKDYIDGLGLGTISPTYATSGDNKNKITQFTTGSGDAQKTYNVSYNGDKVTITHKNTDNVVVYSIEITPNCVSEDDDVYTERVVTDNNITDGVKTITTTSKGTNETEWSETNEDVEYTIDDKDYTVKSSWSYGKTKTWSIITSDGKTLACPSTISEPDKDKIFAAINSISQSGSNYTVTFATGTDGVTRTNTYTANADNSLKLTGSTQNKTVNNKQVELTKTISGTTSTYTLKIGGITLPIDKLTTDYQTLIKDLTSVSKVTTSDTEIKVSLSNGAIITWTKGNNTWTASVTSEAQVRNTNNDNFKTDIQALLKDFDYKILETVNLESKTGTTYDITNIQYNSDGKISSFKYDNKTYEIEYNQKVDKLITNSTSEQNSAATVITITDADANVTTIERWKSDSQASNTNNYRITTETTDSTTDIKTNTVKQGSMSGADNTKSETTIETKTKTISGNKLKQVKTTSSTGAVTTVVTIAGVTIDLTKLNDDADSFEELAALADGKIVVTKDSDSKVTKIEITAADNVYTIPVTDGKTAGDVVSKPVRGGLGSDGIYYGADGAPYKGMVDKIYYEDGVKGTGEFEGKFYVKGDLANGEYKSKYYNEGVEITELFTRSTIYTTLRNYPTNTSDSITADTIKAAYIAAKATVDSATASEKDKTEALQKLALISQFATFSSASNSTNIYVTLKPLFYYIANGGHDKTDATITSAELERYLTVQEKTYTTSDFVELREKAEDAEQYPNIAAQLQTNMTNTLWNVLNDLVVSNDIGQLDNDKDLARAYKNAQDTGNEEEIAFLEKFGTFTKNGSSYTCETNALYNYLAHASSSGNSTDISSDEFKANVFDTNENYKLDAEDLSDNTLTRAANAYNEIFLILSNNGTTINKDTLKLAYIASKDNSRERAILNLFATYSTDGTPTLNNAYKAISGDDATITQAEFKTKVIDKVDLIDADEDNEISVGELSNYTKLLSSAQNIFSILSNNGNTITSTTLLAAYKNSTVGSTERNILELFATYDTKTSTVTFKNAYKAISSDGSNITQADFYTKLIDKIDAGSNNEISVEELSDYLDPVSSAQNIFSILSYNNNYINTNTLACAYYYSEEGSTERDILELFATYTVNANGQVTVTPNIAFNYLFSTDLDVSSISISDFYTNIIDKLDTINTDEDKNTISVAELKTYLKKISSDWYKSVFGNTEPLTEYTYGGKKYYYSPNLSWADYDNLTTFDQDILWYTYHMYDRNSYHDDSTTGARCPVFNDDLQYLIDAFKDKEDATT